MLSTPYFHIEALRQRFLRNLKVAHAQRRITAEELRFLQHLGDTEQPIVGPQESCEIYRLTLEDGSPESLAMVTVLLIEHWTADMQSLYLDTLTEGLLRFADRAQLGAWLKAAFSVKVDARPDFQVRLVEGSWFEQRMWQVIDHQAQTLRWLATDVQQLPTLAQVLRQVLAPRLISVWPDGNVDLQAPLVQIVEHSGGRHGANREHPVSVQSLEQLVVDGFTGKRLPHGQRRRFTGVDGRPLDSVTAADFDLKMADLQDDYEHLIGDYWSDPDPYGLTRRQRFAQALADGFNHHVWLLQQPVQAAGDTLAQVAASPLYELCGVTISHLALTVDAQGPCKLVSLYLIHLGQGAYALYSPFAGLRHLKDRQALNDLVNSPTGRRELRRYLSLDDQKQLPALEAAANLQLQEYVLDKPLFYDCIDGIIGLQMRNLGAALKLHCRDQGHLHAMLDDALDIRALIDGRLPFICAGGRWLNEPTDFHASWSLAKQSSAATGHATDTASWGEQLGQLENTLSVISDHRPLMEVLARQSLSPYLAALGYPEPLAGHNIRLTWNEPGACADPEAQTPCNRLRAAALTDMVLERISGAGTAILARSKVQLPAEHSRAPGLGPITVELLEPVVRRVAAELRASCTGRLNGFYDQPLRIATAQVQVNQALRATREQLLRLELAVAQRKRDISTTVLNLLQGILDRPASTMRRTTVDACAIGIELDGRRFRLGLNVAWVLRQPEPQDQGLLFWSPFIGLKTFESRKALEAWLQARLAEPDWRARWLAVFPGEDRQWMDTRLADGATLTLGLERVDGNFLQRMQQDGRQALVSEFAAALRDATQHRLNAAPFKSCLDLASNDDGLLTWLDALAIRIQNLLFTSAMPDWVTMASLDDLELYTELLKDYFRNGDPAHDFLAGVPPLQSFARHRLQEVLQRDFPGHDLDPDTVSVVTTRYVLAPVPAGQIPSSVPGSTLINSESLVDFSLNHFSQVGEGVLSVKLPEGSPVPPGLHGTYVARLVHELDVGLHYQALLAERFDVGQPEYATRRERFMRQMPSRLLATAMEMKLQGLLSRTAFNCLECVLDMPDAAARQKVDGQTVVLRPLTLLPRADMRADPVEGFFLIGPKDPTQGPVVLHIQFSERFSLREFRDHDHLLAELRVQGPLRDLLLSRLEPQVRKRYDHGGLTEAHLPFSTEGVFDTTLVSPGRVSLGTATVEGNALRHLFDAVVQLMQHLSRKQAVTSAQADWATFVGLMKLVTEQVLIFVPGKLGLLVSLWQTQSLMGKSVNAATERQWGEALGEFTVALGVLVSTRREEVEPLRPRSGLRPPVFSWRNSALSPALRQRLSEFEVLDVELSSLQYDALYNLYNDPLTQTRYAILEGKVYRVHQFDGAWRIKGSTGEGPKLRLDSEQRWQLDLELGLRGGMPSSGSNDEAMQAQIEVYITVRAEGMKNIRVYSREEARKINMARFQALGYLKTALFNLNAPIARGLAEPAKGVLKDSFGVEEVTPQIIDGVRQRFTELFVALSEPSLAPLSSSRFILGTARRGYESVAAFVLVGDPRRRVFLSDLFFSPPTYVLKDVLPGNRAFNAPDHFRASVMIHEMSHQTCETVDFAYLDASAPPSEMIDERIPEWASYKKDLQVMRERALSHRTPVNRLFRINGRTGWRDLAPSDGRMFRKVVALTGRPNLELAREAFLNDPAIRSQVILGNADSVAMLANLLGRERFS